ncbi:MAG: tetrahydromethanopterin S-methyltransferase subunit C [Methanosarcinales archaeon]|jgi:tetrahydromethanopterin S-methyltransferase subunit C|nr:tetrahydromethanopterin S-methyltransferase subunit C [Methanosarcinales archaeon]
MTAAKIQNGNGKEDKKFFLFEKTALIGLVSGLAGIYTALLISFRSASFADSVNTPFSFAAGIGMIAAIVWAADAVRKISKYGLGTGVPSVGMFGIGIACVIAVFSVFLNTIWSPVIGTALALIIGLVSGKLINSALGMNIPDMEKRIAEITTGCTLAIISSVVIVAGTVQNISGYEYIMAGIVALGFIGVAVAVFHAYNANLGPDEMKDRTRMLTILDASLLLLIFAAAALFWRAGQNEGIQTIIGSTVTIFMSIVFIFTAYYKFWTYVKRDAWKITETGLLPGEEDLN